MVHSFGVAVCAAYLLGLLLSRTLGSFVLAGIAFPWAAIALPLGALAWGAITPKSWRLGWRLPQWALLGAIASLAVLYMGLRSPQPSSSDIINYVGRVQAIAPSHLISGKVVNEPSLNRDLKGRFAIAVHQLAVEDAKGVLTFQIPVRGQVYVTAPLLQVTGLHQGMDIVARGRLYLPQPALNPNGFDFSGYLRQQGRFTGFVAEKLRFSEQRPWGLWQIRQRIVRAQVNGLGSPLGQLVSAMALGRRAVDVPANIAELFSRVGLAHTLAASGFQVSLLLGCGLALLRSRSPRVQLISGLLILLTFLFLAGFEASVVRAVLMGVATLIGLIMERKTKPVGALLVAVTLMLLCNPYWLWDVGFQLSVTATLGLIVLATPMTQALDWLPVGVASAITVPTAATLWTLPLMLYHFNVLSGISIALNVLVTPLITVISLGGIGSSVVALISPWLGSWVARLLYFPTQLLLWLAEASSHLPGSAITIGQMALWQLIGLYTALVLSLLLTRQVVRRLLWFAFVAIITLPISWHLLTQVQITVLASGNELLWIEQEHGHTTLINSGTAKTAFYTLAPFLRQAGVNRLDNAIAVPFAETYIEGWQSLLRQIPTRHLYGSPATSPLPDVAGAYHQLKIGQKNALKRLTIQPLGTEHPILRLTTFDTSWLLLPDLAMPLQTHLAKAGSVLQSQVLLWDGDELSDNLLAAVHPQVVICYGRTLSEALERKLSQAGHQVFWTMRDGAVIWQPHKGFQAYLETQRRNSSPWE
jgi:competence protein ComEC